MRKSPNVASRNAFSRKFRRIRRKRRSSVSKLTKSRGRLGLWAGGLKSEVWTITLAWKRSQARSRCWCVASSGSMGTHSAPHDRAPSSTILVSMSLVPRMRTLRAPVGSRWRMPDNRTCAEVMGRLSGSQLGLFVGVSFFTLFHLSFVFFSRLFSATSLLEELGRQAVVDE